MKKKENFWKKYGNLAGWISLALSISFWLFILFKLVSTSPNESLILTDQKFSTHPIYKIIISFTHLGKPLSSFDLNYSAFLCSKNENISVDIGNVFIVTTKDCQEKNCIRVKDGTYYLYIEIPFEFKTGAVEIYRKKFVFDMSDGSIDFANLNVEIEPKEWNFETSVQYV